jgi:peptidyl-prolyl cis-trans isomerase SurA
LQARAEIQMLDRIVAVVDRTTIPQSELDSRIVDIVQRSKAGNIGLPPMNVLREQVLDQLITETLQLNAAGLYGVITSDAEVNQSIANIQRQNRVNAAQFEVALKKEGQTLNEFREGMRRQLTINNITQGLVNQRIRISDLEIDNFLQSAEAKFWVSPDFLISHILVSLPASTAAADIEVAEKKANDLYEQLTAGANFTELAIANSDGPSALKGGDLGWRKSSDLPSLFAEIAPKLAIGEVAKPARSQAGFHILKLVNKRGETNKVIRQSKARHILLEPNELLDDEKTRLKLAGIRDQILAGELEFKAMAKEHSKDLGTKLSGGELGWSSPGQFVKEFEQNIQETKIGDISEPFKTQFGWHILQVQERRDEDFSEAVIRNKARELLLGRRYEDEVQVWLQEMKDEAFIETKI